MKGLYKTTMNNNKPWYEKIGIWIGIFAGIFTILGISIFGGRAIIDIGSGSSASTESEVGSDVVSKSGNNDSSQPSESIETEESSEESSEASSEASSESEIDPMLNPIPLKDVSEFYSDGIGHSESTITDNTGKEHNGYAYMVAGDFFVELEGSVVYRNDNQYNRFFGLVIIDDSEKNDEDCGWVKIYGDDNLLFDTGAMGKGIAPKDFDIDISTYSEIKIVFKHGNFSSNVAKYAQCYLVDTYFE